MVSSICLVVSLLVVGGDSAVEAAWRPFPVDWSSDAASPVSVSYLLDAPAGKHGFVRVSGGHLVRPSGARLRIWGVNITGRATVPAKEIAPHLAAHLARCGVNCVRFHFLDNRDPNGLIDSRRNDTRSLDPQQLDRLDFFVAELKKRGIYTNLNLNVGRVYKAGDGLPDHELLGFAKALTYFHPRLIELQREYAAQLLTHRNPYTGNEYRSEPAVVLIEFVNENSIVESWFSNRLLGKNTRKNPGTWTDIPASYERELTERYNRWLRERHTPADLARLRSLAGVAGESPLPRLQPGQFAAAPKELFHTEAAFYMELEQQFFDSMARFLRDELKAQPLLVGTSDHNHGKSGYPLLTSTSRLDVVDGHVYWQHPRYLTDPASGRQRGFEIPNTPMVNDPLRSTIVQLSRTAVSGKPYTISEVNHPFPSEFACEGIPLLAAYAALHDWDGVVWYTLSHAPLVGEASRAIGHFDIGPDPLKMTQLAAGALLFLRPDVQPAKRTVERSYSREQIVESLRLPGSAAPYFTPGFPLAAPLLHATRIASLVETAPLSFETAASDPLVSDTGELTWSGATAKQGVVQVDTPRSQALVGFCGKNPKATRNLATRGVNDFCAITLSALDDRPIAQSTKLMLTATARVANSGMRWRADRKSLDAWGTPPTVIEPVTGTAILKGLDRADRVTLQPLDATGRPIGNPAELRSDEEGWHAPLADTPTTWYFISVRR